MPRPTFSRLLLHLLLPAAAAPALFAQGSIATNAPGGVALSQRVVAYTLDARINTDSKTLDATETLTYRNLTGQSLNSFPFHLYLNAFRPESSFSRETHAYGGIRESESEDTYPREKLGSITISHIDADGFGDLTGAMQFAAPDDGNADDHTVAVISLPHPLAPGDSITFHLAFHDKFPLSVARNGYKRDFLMGGQWFPKVGVFWHGAWNCHQYHATTEFFSDFGTYNVHLTLPQRYLVGASGVQTDRNDNTDGTRTWGFIGEDIHDFAWAASPNFTVTDGTFLSSMGPVRVHVLALKAHPAAGKRYLDITTATLGKFDQWYGPYPYKQITVIDPEPDSEMEGMEYPTLFTGGTSWYEPTHLTEIVTEHEFGHQYWYGMVATNEFEEAWLDEGINSYTEVNVLASILGPKTSVLNRRWANAGDGGLERLQYLGVPSYDPVTRYAWQFRNANSYAGVTYGKTATLLATLEGVVGADTMREAMHTWFMRYRFTHPSTEDFLHTIEEVAIARGRATGTYTSSQNGKDGGQGTPTLANPNLSPDLTAVINTVSAPARSFQVSSSSLRPFFNQAVYGTALLDYSVDSISSDPVRWWEPGTGKNGAKIPHNDVVYVRRRGDFVLPVSLEVTFSDGSRVREHWDGADRWKRFSYVRPETIVAAEVDPDHTVLLDTDFFNNSKTEDPDHTASRKLTALWVWVQQTAEQIGLWLV